MMINFVNLEEPVYADVRLLWASFRRRYQTAVDLDFTLYSWYYV